MWQEWTIQVGMASVIAICFVGHNSQLFEEQRYSTRPKLSNTRAGVCDPW